MSASDNLTIAQRWLDAFNGRQLDALLALYADDAEHTSPKIRVLHPQTGGKLIGKPKLREWWADAMARLPNLRYQPLALTADSERVFMEYLRTVPGEADLPVAEVLVIRQGKIVASRVYHG